MISSDNNDYFFLCKNVFVVFIILKFLGSALELAIAAVISTSMVLFWLLKSTTRCSKSLLVSVEVDLGWLFTKL